MTTFTSDDLTYFQRRLQQRCEELRSAIADSLRQSQREDFTALAGRVHDAGEESVAELVMSTNFTLLQREVRELRDFEAAYKRLRDGTYGVCQECGGNIGRERLEVNPTAQRCIRCQTRREQAARGGRDATPSL